MVVETKKTGVSVAMQAMLSSMDDAILQCEKKSPMEFSIKIANTLEEREAVFKLGYQIYLEKEFIKPNPQEYLIQSYDQDPRSIILIVQDRNKKIAGSVTLVFNESSQLPAEKIYASELKTLKKNGEKLVELSRLIINPEFRNSKEILILLFNYLAIYSYHVENYDSLVVEVNPRHKNYYKMLLNFDEIGEEKACPSVLNAPAILLHLPLSRYQSEVKRCASQVDQDKKERSLYPYFLRSEQETLVAYYLERQVKQMSEEELHYFGLSISEKRLAKAV